jgi:hypothetical protein
LKAATHNDLDSHILIPLFYFLFFDPEHVRKLGMGGHLEFS